MKIKPHPAKKKKAPRKITADYLHNAGLHYLQRFAASSAQFRKVMMRKVARSCAHHTDQDKEACARLVDALVEKFRASGLLNDELYTRGMVHSLRRAGKSRQAITAKMQAKGIGKSGTAAALTVCDEENHADTAEAERAAAQTLVRKKKLRDRPPQKALAALARAGFSYDVAKEALDVELEDL